jgi:DNA-binding protein HU-beta
VLAARTVGCRRFSLPGRFRLPRCGKGTPVNKQEFVESLAERCELSQAAAGRTLDAILESLTQAMTDGEEVRFTGFGTFSSPRRRARDAVNPQDPTQKIRIRAKHVPKFKPGASLRAAISEASGPADTAAASPTDDRNGGDERSAPAQTPAAATSSGESGEWVPLGRRS